MATSSLTFGADAVLLSQFGPQRSLLRAGMLYNALAELSLSGAAPLSPDGSRTALSDTLLGLLQHVRARLPFTLDAFRTRASGLLNAADELVLSNPSGVLNNRAVNSSNTDILEGSVSNSAADDVLNVRVDQVATKQINETFAFRGSFTNSFTPGQSTLSILINSIEYTVQVDVRSTDINEDVLRQIAGSINFSSAGAHVRAEVTQVDGDFYQVRIESKKTGEGAAFDVFEQGGGLVTETGLNRIAVPAQDARVLIDGDFKSFSRNIATVATGVTLDLKRIALSNVRVSVGGNTSTGPDAMRRFVTGFNSVLDFLDVGVSLNGNVSSRLRSAASARGEGLAEIGITIGENGRLRLDEERFVTALEKFPERVQERIGGTTGLATVVRDLIRDILDQPFGITPTDKIPKPVQSLLESTPFSLVLDQDALKGVKFDLAG